MTARFRLAAALLVSAAVSPARAIEASPTRVSGVELRLSVDARASDSPAPADRREPEGLAVPAEVRRAVRVILPSPYGAGIPSPR